MEYILMVGDVKTSKHAIAHFLTRLAELNQKLLVQTLQEFETLFSEIPHKTLIIFFSSDNKKENVQEFLQIKKSKAIKHDHLILMEEDLDLKFEEIIENVKRKLTDGEQNFVPVECHQLMKMKFSPTDIYIRINQGQNGHQYIKRIHRFDEISYEDVDRYIKQGLRYFFIPEPDLDAFLEEMKKQSMNQIQTKKKSDALAVHIEEMELAKSLLLKLGINLPTVGLVENTMKQIESELQSSSHSKGTQQIFSVLKTKSKNSFKISYLIIYLAHKMITKSDWGQSEHLKKISLAAIFHDIFLKNDQHLLINTTEEMYLHNLNREEIELLQGHAQKAAKFILLYPDLPIGTENIILHHHGDSNGQGFSTKLSSRISPLDLVFITAEEMAVAILMQFNQGREIKMTELIDQIESKYKDGTIAKATILLREVLKEKEK